MRSTCERSCDGDRRDCNRDLSKGQRGDGCETIVSRDIASCGACGHRCAQPSTGAPAVCEQGECRAVSTQLGERWPSSDAERGSPGGAPFQQICPPGEVLVGLEAAVGQDDHILRGLAVRCAELLLTGTAEQPAFVTVRSHTPYMMSGISDASAPVREYFCPSDSVVTGVFVRTSNAPFTDGLERVVNLSLTCFRIKLQTDRTLLFEPTQNIYVVLELPAGALATHSDLCNRMNGVHVGFIGHAGAIIDGLRSYCGSVSLRSDAYAGGSAAP